MNYFSKQNIINANNNFENFYNNGIVNIYFQSKEEIPKKNISVNNNNIIKKESSIIYSDDGSYIKPRTVFIKELNIYVSIYPVTFEEYGLFCKDTNRKFSYLNGFENKSVTKINWNDAYSYCKWLEKKINKKCELVNSYDWKIIKSYNIIEENGLYEWCQDGDKDEKKIKIGSLIETVDLNLKNLKISFRYIIY